MMVRGKKFTDLLVLLLGVFVLTACTSNETKNDTNLTESIPDFVEESNFENIDWENKAVLFNDNILGNENKSGVIGADMPSLNPQKWMWHLWGVDDPTNTKFTVVGFHRESQTIYQITTNGWSIPLGGPNNGADVHAPSTVKIPEPGEWAIFLYVDEKLFDILVYDIDE
jgi:outer membrane biogenesis lipoprotein LolB